MLSSLIFIISFSFIPAVLVFAADFSYSGITGPAFWGKFNETCLQGENQSPIDIPYDEFLKFTKPDYISFDDSHNVEIENKGHSIEISKNLSGKLKIKDDDYELLQFHFHTPSEHRVDGKYHDVEAHFVFTDKEGKYSVVGVFYDISDQPSEFFNPIIANIPHGEDKKTIEFIGLSSVLKDIDWLNKAYNYFGSLTTPPCTEGVIWWVAHSVQPIGKDQFFKLRDTTGFNSRYTQVRKGEK
ncbi:alpha carbonic anhydrase [Glomus cerebriforme]|uniref:Carbonic anhydrase n=1 Tax=Glomus cerebriforme TaxID=658196 RepID=A0A397SR39_9GLOM|nr:alpha carbonic anhydrase [Glomus cerebriforme]